MFITPTFLIIGLTVLLILYIVSAYNGLVALNVRVSEAWSDISAQLKRRYDLIPNLIETVKGYAKHESQTLEMVVKARNAAMNAQSVNDKQIAEGELSNTLKSIFALSENYPDLKANTNFLELQTELADTENKILSSRRFYNVNVRDLNIKIEQFPTNIISKYFNFSKKDFFEIPESEFAAAQNPVKVGF